MHPLAGGEAVAVEDAAAQPLGNERVVDQGEEPAGDLLPLLVGQEGLLLLDAAAEHGAEEAAEQAAARSGSR